ncbi:hypothetical protein AWC29_11890 [Mycobacterium triplex]|uniref:Uncharacterized protein n=1 Tax=Mycobacterium triplex TaxID=47839 RepID=A0ABX3W877_9MYCO|nr:hypothetical protein AWC29_11890 [Mycobacterium triplex]
MGYGRTGRRGFHRPWRRPARNLHSWGANRTTAGRKFRRGQIEFEVVEIFRQVGADFAEVAQRTGRQPKLPQLSGTPRCASAFCALFGATCGRRTCFRPRASFSESGEHERRGVEKVLSESQSRSSGAPILKVQKRFQHLQIR